MVAVMEDKLAKYIKRYLAEDGKSIRWMADQIGISGVHLGTILKGRQNWTWKVLSSAAKVLKITLLQAYAMSGLVTDADLLQYSLDQSLDDEVVELLAIPGMQKICLRTKRLIRTHPEYKDSILQDLSATLDRESALCQMRDSNGGEESQ